VLGNDIAVYHVRSNEVRRFFFNIFVTSKKDKMLTFAKKSCKQAKLVTKTLKGGKTHDINCLFLFVNWVRFISGKIKFLTEVNKFYLLDEKKSSGKKLYLFPEKVRSCQL
jgi:hypothetical protein